jgi:hypothetical protein
MATNRFQFSDDFVLKNGRVGINSADPQAELDVRGTIKADNLTVTGFATFTSYEGFLRSDYNIDESLTITNGSALSGEVIVGTGVTATNNAIDYAGQGQIDSLKVYNTFTPPRGGTEERPTKAKPGQLYYNEDFKTIEFYDGNVWRQVDNTTRSGRAVIGDNSASHIMDFVNIQSLGNALNFGTLSDSRVFSYACASSTRGLWGGGVTPTIVNTIDYITIASEGNAIDFGDLLSNTAQETTSCSSSTRGIWGGGYSVPGSSRINVIQYVSISTLGNALDFGDLTSLGVSIGSFASPTRGVFGGGYRTSPGLINTVDFITIASTGNAVSFGTLSEGSARLAGCSNGTRGLFAGGRAYPSSPGPSSFITNRIEYITVASTGNGQDFGDLTSSNRNMLAAAANSTRGIFAGGYSPTNSNVIDYVTIASTGNAQDFGDLTKAKRGVSACSDSHGGLGGF